MPGTRPTADRTAVASGRMVSPPLHERIAGELRAAIVRGDYPPGSQLPSESALAGTHGVARGTIRAALAAVEAAGLITSRRGTPRVVLGTGVSQSFDELRSFAQWARAAGHSPGGRFVTRELRPAAPAEANALQLQEGAEVLYTVRLRTLNGTPIFTERCTYPTWLAGVIAGLDPDCPSVTAEVRRLTGVVAVRGTHAIDVTRADHMDARLLGATVGDPVLRRRGITHRADGTPCDYTDDHYLEGTATFALHNSVTTNTLSRHVQTVATAEPPLRAGTRR